mgnify:FL=1
MYHRKKKRKKEMYSNLYIEEGKHYNSNIETEKIYATQTIDTTTVYSDYTYSKILKHIT